MPVTNRTLYLLAELRDQVGGQTDNVVRDLAGAWVTAWDELNQAWQETIAEIVERYLLTGVWPTPAQLARLTRYNTATFTTQQALTVLTAAAVATTGAGVDQVVAATATAEPLVMASQLPANLAAAALKTYSHKVAPAALEAIALRAKQQITATTWPISGEATEAIRRSLIRGVAAGDNPREVARTMLARVEGEFNGGLQRAMVVARTEMLDAYRDASAHVHDANRDVLDGWTWSASIPDPRTCPACWGMHGTHHPLIQPGPWGHQQCIPAGAEVHGPGVVASTTRWFVGELVEITTEQGRHLSVTPNHPVLTTQGWVDAGEIHQGHHVVTAAPRERDGAVAGSEPHHYQRPALIEDVAGAFDGAGLVGSVVVPTAAVDFHGDGAGSDVHVVRAHGALLDDLQARCSQPPGHESFLGGDVRVAGVPRDALLPGDRRVAQALERAGAAPLGSMGGGRDLAVLFRGALVGAQSVALGDRPQCHACVDQAAVDQAAGSAQRFGDGVAGFSGEVAAHDGVGVHAGGGDHGRGGLLAVEGVPVGRGAEDATVFEVADEDGGAKSVPGRDRLGRFAGEVGVDRVVDVRRRDFTGHVYNLQTVDGWYAANGIVTHNCRCARLPKLKTWRELGIDLDELPDVIPNAQDEFDQLDEADQRAIVGPGRLAMMQAGKITLADIPTLKQNTGWRPSYVPRNRAQLDQLVRRRRAQ